MNKSKQKKALPTCVPVVAIVVVIIIVVAMYIIFGKGGHGKPTSNADQIKALQKAVNEGQALPIPRQSLERRGVVFPANYDQLVADRAAREGGGARGPMGPGGQRGR